MDAIPTAFAHNRSRIAWHDRIAGVAEIRSIREPAGLDFGESAGRTTADRPNDFAGEQILSVTTSRRAPSPPLSARVGRA
ncbi:hypothetical protein [Fimbriiglobus ruber]|uniref:hypothetical protein n=1 Tax=Fimbriiglobus ruber TaxID=1908690 RepID=UPI000B4B8780|nr:hypothetical protein [Fimbriiglobus ruber]